AVSPSSTRRPRTSSPPPTGPRPDRHLHHLQHAHAQGLRRYRPGEERDPRRFGEPHLCTLQVYLGSSYVNDFNYLGRTYRVTAQAEAPFREDITKIADLRTRNDRGQMVPIGSVATFRDITGPYRVPRYNLYPAAELQGNTLPGYSTGYALAA